MINGSFQFSHLNKGKKGSVSFFVLLFILAALFFFQSYLSFTTSDYNTGWDLDDRTQRITEEANLRLIVKQALLTYYERGYFSETSADPEDTVSALIGVQLGYLNTNNNVSYTLTTTPPLPSGTRSNFWPLLEADGTTSLGGSFNVSESSASRDFDHVNDFLPPTVSAFEVQYGTTPTFEFVFTRTVAGVDSSVTVTARMWQVPVTDFNVYAYAHPVENGIPENPPAMNNGVLSDLQNGTLRGVSLSDIGSIAGQPTTSYPFYYRELFSAGAQVWQYLFYTNGYLSSFLGQTTTPFKHNLNKMTDYDPAIDGLSYNTTGPENYWELDVNDFDQNIYINGSEQALHLIDTGSISSDTPIVVYIYNRNNAAETELHISGNLSRPIMLIAENAYLVLDANSSVNGAIYLDRDNSSLDAVISNGHSLTVNGSFASKGNQPISSLIDIESYSNGDLRRLAPRFLLVDTF